MRAQLFRTTVGHTRVEPVGHRFTHRSFAWLVDVGSLGTHTMPHDQPALLRMLFAFRARDHVGDPRLPWIDNVRALARTEGIDIDSCRVLALTNPRALGYVFNPLSLYWCLDPQQHVVCVIAEVHNTYGGRHAYVVRPDNRDRAAVDKFLYVSPFNDTSGHYTMRMPLPDNEFNVTVTLHRTDHSPLVTTWTGAQENTASAFAGALFAPVLVAARIRIHGVYLWARGLAVQPRPVTQPQEPA